MNQNTTVRIIVVDDQTIVSNYYKDVLNDNGYQNVIVFNNPYEVIELVEKWNLNPDIVISDYQMNHINGIQFLERLTRTVSFLKGFIITGSPDNVTSNPDNFPIIMKNHDSITQIMDLIRKFEYDINITNSK